MSDARINLILEALAHRISKTVGWLEDHDEHTPDCYCGFCRALAELREVERDLAYAQHATPNTGVR